MGEEFEQYAREVMSGSRRGFMPALLRAGLAVAEPSYAGAMTARNALYDAGLFRAERLGRPVISIGNLTTGGTGKTPMVRWLAGQLRDAGRHVAILSRGYKSAGGEGQLGDEQQMLDTCLNAPGLTPILLRANPSRIQSASDVLREHPETDVFLLDDAFQHRKVARDLDIVLISATEPFGFGHVLPRGLLREPMRGLGRAGAIVLTHADRVDEAAREQIKQQIRRFNVGAPIYRASHAPIGFRAPATSPAAPTDRSLDEIKSRRVFAFCGIGNPQVFGRQLEELGASLVGHRWFSDHHRYTREDLDRLRNEASSANADVLVTTEKDWVKLAVLSAALAGTPEIWRLEIAIRFIDEDEERLFQQLRSVLA